MKSGTIFTMMLFVTIGFALPYTERINWPDECKVHKKMSLEALMEKVNTSVHTLMMGPDPQKIVIAPEITTLAKNVTGVNTHDNCLGDKKFDPHKRLCGNDWPCKGTTMIGVARLMNVAALLLTVLDDNVPGGFAELGVWRGGTCIFVRRLLDLLSQHERRVDIFDAFEQLPGYGKSKKFLMNSQDSVKETFRRMGTLDRSYFHKGLFQNTVPLFSRNHHDNIAVLRIDGNFYDSYQDAMYYLYDRVPTGGYVIFDDFSSHPAVQRFWKDFTKDQRINETLVPIDRFSVYFRKTRSVPIQMALMRPPKDVNRLSNIRWEGRPEPQE